MQALLEVVHDLFEEQTSVEECVIGRCCPLASEFETSVEAVVSKIMQKARTLLNCERCVVLLDNQHHHHHHGRAARLSATSFSSLCSSAPAAAAAAAAVDLVATSSDVISPSSAHVRTSCRCVLRLPTCHSFYLTSSDLILSDLSALRLVTATANWVASQRRTTYRELMSYL